MFCPNCGANAPDTEKFCPTCGTALSSGDNAPAAPEDEKSKDIVALIKSKLPLIIGVAVALVAVVIIFNLFFGGAESVAEKYAKAYLKADYKKADKYVAVSFEDSATYYAEEADKDLDEYLEDSHEVDSLDEYYEDMKESADDSRSDTYGDNWKTKCKVLASRKYDDDEFDDLIDELEDSYNEDLLNADDVKDACTVWVQYSIKGSDGEDYSVIELTLVKVGMSWKVLD